MSLFFHDLKREAGFLLRQKSVATLLVVAFTLSLFSVITGLAEVAKQNDTIARLLEYDKADQRSVLDKYEGYGSIAYYSFHLTYLPPSPLTFSAMGQRDVIPWKHRVRMLALEGQIYETDSDNPELSYSGRIDYAFIISVLAPLFVILLLHDLRAAERNSGRYDLLVITARHASALWWTRCAAIVLFLSLALITPFVVGAVIAGANTLAVASVAAISVGQICFWAVICYGVGKIPASAPQLASILLGGWLVTAVLIPVVGEQIINHQVESPMGGDIVLAQREAVNDAWDLPMNSTFEPFIKTHPQWKDYTAMDSTFEWKWYYAFQQVGDQKVEALSNAYRTATEQKNALASIIAWFSPTMLVQRTLTQIAGTDIHSALQYEQQVRDFHRELRYFYYPLIFNKIPYDTVKLANRPEFTVLKHVSK